MAPFSWQLQISQRVAQASKGYMVAEANMVMMMVRKCAPVEPVSDPVCPAPFRLQRMLHRFPGDALEAFRWLARGRHVIDLASTESIIIL